MHIFSSSIVSRNVSGSDTFKTEIRCQCHLMRRLLLTPWFHLACSSYTCRHIEFGTGIPLFELRNPSSLFISCLTFFWWSCHFSHRLQGPTRNFRTGYVVSFFFGLCSILWTWFIHVSLSRTQWAASSSPSLASHSGIYGALGFQNGKDIVFSESGLVMKTESLDTYSAKYLSLWYHTLLEPHTRHGGGYVPSNN